MGRLDRHLVLAAMDGGVRSEAQVLADYVAEVATLHGVEPAELEPRFARFLDVYHHRTAEGTPEEWAAIYSGDVEHSFIRISKPYRFRRFETIPMNIAVLRRELRTGAARPAVLDYGGGFGNDAIVYARSGFEAHYADLVALRNTDIVRRRFELRGLDIPIYDVAGLPSRRFDAITAMDVLEHVYDVEEATAQLCARIVPGGLLCCANAFDSITHDGDHHDKNRVYVELFRALMEAAGFELAADRPPLEAFRRGTDPVTDVQGELERLRPLLYGVTRRIARARCDVLVERLRTAPPGVVEWVRLPATEPPPVTPDEADASGGSVCGGDAPRRRGVARTSAIGSAAYAAAARHAPGVIRRAVWKRRRARTAAGLDPQGDPVAIVAALADWTAVLRIAEHRLRAL